MGSSWNGRMCCAVMSVARSVGGRGFSVGSGQLVNLNINIECGRVFSSIVTGL